MRTDPLWICSTPSSQGPVIHQSSVSQRSTVMQWIEEKRLEMGMDTAVTHALKQLRNLRGKNRKALRQEFQEWFEGDTDPEDQTWMNHHEWW